MSQKDKYKVIVEEDYQYSAPTHMDYHNENKQLCCAITVTRERCSKHTAIGSIYCLPHIKSITQGSQIVYNDDGTATILGYTITPKVRNLLDVNNSMPQQRTKEWYEMRKTKITASTAAAFLLVTDYEYQMARNGIVCLSTEGATITQKHIGKRYCMAFSSHKDEMTKQVVDDSPWFQSKYMVHGVKFEPVIRDIYEQINNVLVLDFGLMPHSTVPWLGASPDGITTSGKMIEIKAPQRKKLTKETILQYWMQMQLQMEVCDLDECDFVEGVIREYSKE